MMNLTIVLATLARFELIFLADFGNGNRYHGSVEVDLRKQYIEFTYWHMEDLCGSYYRHDLPERFFSELDEEPIESVPDHIMNLARNVVRERFPYEFEES